MEQMVHQIYQRYGWLGILGAGLLVVLAVYIVLSWWQDRGK
jgi:hypothetical protein